jgi:hypothetical protein
VCFDRRSRRKGREKKCENVKAGGRCQPALSTAWEKKRSRKKRRGMALRNPEEKRLLLGETRRRFLFVLRSMFAAGVPVARCAASVAFAAELL